MILFAETTFQLAYPWALALLALIPLLALLKSRSGNQGAVLFSSLHILNRLGPIARGRAGGFRLASLFLSLICLILALTRPQWINRTELVAESGIELILAIDVSRSMQVEDFRIEGSRANRLQAAKKVTRDFIRGRTTDRIGILAFAGRPYLASPLTLSKAWLEGEQGLGRVQIGMVEDGTAIGSALAAAAKRLDKRPSKSKVIVLLTDGVNNAGKLSPLEAAKLAHTLGIRVYTIAVGTYGDYVVQTPAGPQRLTQEFDEETLKEIARIADGEYFRAQDTSGLEKIFGLIDEMEKTETKRQTRIEASELFQWFAIAGLCFCLLTLVGDDTFWRRFP
ncbi:MAG: VWA domain-containing protein [Verrucomicrobiales bacterium]|jgi:Ca-activated chloride channel homolog|nr:VWA domain-containing protein [Verrucomicrobiales bacterium]MDP4792258.1 VWA domain-containing protein [Verrucomicrobiales bacterium]MDP4939077.1 VWA domain-containing protein [Verrucomicrobiales bacterium]MDP5005383.1 VWA domain-containing protein [Verrucomicrobiales bacterium]